MALADLIRILASVLLIGVGQVLFKVVGLKLRDGVPPTDPRLLAVAAASMAIYAVATVVWILALRNVPLTRAYPFMALSFVLVPLAGIALFSEGVRASYFAGIALIVAGVVVVNLAGRS